MFYSIAFLWLIKGTYTTVPEFEVEEKFKDPNGLTWPVLSVEFIFKDPDDERVNVGRIYAKYYTDET
uniref:MATH domain-containing protein n=1 Tax=Bracon brevicornis TaxID=1563983 RepID=A0A6V7KQ10_9HYME